VFVLGIGCREIRKRNMQFERVYWDERVFAASPAVESCRPLLEKTNGGRDTRRGTRGII
jgi:hypothetical protein